MPDERLAGLIHVYGYWPLPMENISTFSPGLIAFNLQDSYLEVDGQQRTEPVLMGVATDPTVISYTIRGPGIVSLRCLTSAFERLFDVDPSVDQGLIAMDPARHERLAKVHDRLRSVQPGKNSWFAALDAALIDLLPSVRPEGLAGDFVRLVTGDGPDLSVAEYARRLGCTPRTLERVCKRRFGRTPKRLLRGQRLARTMRLEQEASERVELMEDFTYADLPHYLNEMRRITGLNRKQLREDSLLGADYPYRFEWPDGTPAQTEEELGAWRAEMDRRYRSNPG